jgi:5-enolpyruvylshikimate-3-phosphate synthase
MGACIEINRAERSLTVKRGGTLRGCVIDINPIIDAITILAVVGCFAEGETRLVNGAIARYKECDRIFCIASELKKMGANITALEDGLIIRPSKLHGAHVKSYHDHRMALSLAIAGLAAEETTYIEEFECMHKSYPSFIQDMIQIGAQFKRED